MAISISSILKDSEYKLDQFSPEQITALESSIITKTDKNGKEVFYVKCLVRDKEIKLTPEECVRQLYLDTLVTKYGYPKARIELEVPCKQGRDSAKRIDILVKDENGAPYIVIETKKPKEKEGAAQLESYVRFQNAPLGVLINGDSVEEFYHNRENQKTKTTKLEKISNIPTANQSLKDFLSTKYTLKYLFLADELQKKTLKRIILDFEDVVLANSGVDSFEEIFKLIFCKLYDEKLSARDFDRITDFIDDNNIRTHTDLLEKLKDYNDSKFRVLTFRNLYENETDAEFREKMNKLFREAKEEWQGIFDKDAGFELTTQELRISVSYLQNIKLFNSNFEVVDDAFEYLVTKSQKGDKGQYFTPRYVIDMCVRMLNPKPEETMIDTAAGSCGFPMHTILYVWNKLNPNRKNMLSAQEKTEAESNYVRNKVFAIDFDKRSVRIGRLLNKIAGDGETNVLHLNSLHYTEWKNDVKVGKWEDYYKKGFEKLEEICADKTEYDEPYKKDYSKFDFDIVMANPPFAGDISNENLWGHYDLGKKNVSRDILFIERNLNFLKSGGRMAIVLPQGRFNNSSDKYIRDYIAERCRILAVVGLHGNVFKPHTGTKTSVLFVQKWDEKLCPKKDDYNIFFATMQKPSKDNSGDKIYLKETDSKGETKYKLDEHGHLIVDHDLFNHDGLTQDGIAEAFAEFAKKEGLSFF